MAPPQASFPFLRGPNVVDLAFSEHLQFSFGYLGL